MMIKISDPNFLELLMLKHRIARNAMQCRCHSSPTLSVAESALLRRRALCAPKLDSIRSKLLSKASDCPHSRPMPEWHAHYWQEQDWHEQSPTLTKMTHDNSSELLRRTREIVPQHSASRSGLNDVHCLHKTDPAGHAWPKPPVYSTSKMP